MLCIKESISQAMTTLPTIYTRTGSDGAEHPEDSNLKDLNHLALDKGLSKEQVVEIVELVEEELLSHPSVKRVKRDLLISDPHAIRVKDENQLIEELNR